MLKNLTNDGLSNAGRQNELIELGLTHGFRGIEIDIEDMYQRAKSLGKQFACQFIKSASIQVATFSLPVDIGASDEEYAAQSEKIDTIIDLAGDVKAAVCEIDIAPASDNLPLHENFELHRKRISELADKLAAVDIAIGLRLRAASKLKEGKEFQFVQTVDELLTLNRMVGKPNVGVTVDSWDWKLAGGTPDQVNELKSEQIASVRIAEVCEDVDSTSATDQQRSLPNEDPNSLSAYIFRHLHEIGFEGPVAIAAHSDQLRGLTQDLATKRISQAYDLLLQTSGIVAPSESESDEPEPAAT